MDIRISKIKVSPLIGHKKGLIATVSFVINDSFYVGNLELYSSLVTAWKKIAYPIDQKKKSYFYPFSKEAQDHILQEVEKEYKRLTKEGGEKNG